jgi:hypothetical protein
MAQSEEKFEHFPPIADVVDKTHTGDEDISARPLEEIESLCMQCEEQVGLQTFRLLVEYSHPSGSDTHDAHINPILPRSNRDEFPLRTLRLLKQ